MTAIPSYKQLMNPTLRALEQLGGSGTIDEIYQAVIERFPLTSEQLEKLHNPERGGQTEIEYRLGWARTYLKQYGLIENSQRGVWALTAAGREAKEVDPDAVRRHIQKILHNRSDNGSVEQEVEQEQETTLTWQDELLQTVLAMEPSAFERLAQRLLREAGFIQVEVTGRSGDGGIDGKGIMRLGGFLSFHVIFQCKRYSGAVTASQVRDFRGAMVGRADKGLLITTGSFTKEAVREATRDGAPTIDLIDGDILVERLKELGLGVSTKRIEIEQVEIDHSWFQSL